MAAKQRFPWVAVSAVVAVVVVATVAWLQLPADYGHPSATASRPAFVLTQNGPGMSAELLAEQLAAYDPAPLFIPSAMSSTGAALADKGRPGSTGPFAEFPPALTKTGALEFPVPVPVPRGPVQALRLTERPESPLAIARAETAGKGLVPRGAQVEAVLASTGRVVVSLNLPVSDALPQTDWQPLELLGAVTRSGLLGELVITASSGSVEIDDYFRSHLRKNLRIGDRLPAGFYAFRVGP